MSATCGSQTVSHSIALFAFLAFLLICFFPPQGTGSFFETFRCQSCDKSDPVRSDEYGQFFAVKRSLKPFRGKRDRGLYLREVALMESLGSHENIVRHIRAWQEDMHFFIQMECQANMHRTRMHAQSLLVGSCRHRSHAPSAPRLPVLTIASCFFALLSACLLLLSFFFQTAP